MSNKSRYVLPHGKNSLQRWEPQEAVIHAVRICIKPCDRTRWGNAAKSRHKFGSVGALVGATARAPNGYLGEGTVAGTQIAVKRIVRVDVPTVNLL